MPTILVADDNRLSRELIHDVLEAAGRTVVEASNGGEALDLIAELSPDLVLLDLEMPVKDGFTVLREMRADPRFRGIPVVAVSAKAMKHDQEKIKAAGFDASIAKPIDNAELRSRVRELLVTGRGRQGL